MRRGPPHRAEHGEVEAEPRGVLEFAALVAGGADQRKRRAPVERHQLARRQVQAVGAGRAREPRVAIHQHPRPMALASGHGGGNEGFALRLRQRALAQLHQPEAALQRGIERRELRGDADPPRMRDAIGIRQRERREHRRVGRQHRRHAGRAGPLPCQRRMHVVAQFAAPSGHPEEVEPHVGVLVDVLAHDPRRRRGHLDFQLLMQFAHQRIARRLARLDLAAGKLPVARIEGVRRALAEQEAAVRAQDDCRRDFGNLHLPECLPAKSRANCQATRPLREPRCSAHCSASWRHCGRPASAESSSTPSWRSQCAQMSR